MNKYAFLLLSACLFPAINCTPEKQAENYTNRYDLNFATEYKWPQAGLPCIQKIDSSTVYKGKHPLKLSRLSAGYLLQQFMLPDKKANHIQVSISVKMRDIRDASLLIDRISEKEVDFTTDTVNILCSDTCWNTFSYTLPAEKMTLIGFQILITESQNRKDSNPAVWLHRIEILLDGTPIDRYPLPVVPAVVLNTNTAVAPLPLCDDNYDPIPELNNKKIVALGETMHGSRTLNRLAWQLIKQQIEKNNCKLVLVELPFEAMLSVNKEVQGIAGFSADSLFCETYALYDHTCWKEMIDWITRYNSRHPENRVTVMGTDIGYLEEVSVGFMLHYIQCLNRTHRSPLLNGLCEKLSGFAPSEQALAYLNEHPEMEQIVGNRDYLSIRQALQSSVTATPIPPLRTDLRDYTMKRNASFLIKEYTSQEEKTLIYAHFSHVNYASINMSRLYPSFGAQMKEEYGPQYSCIGLLAGNGTILANTLDSLCVPRPLLPPKSNSLEAALDHRSDSVLYGRAALFPDAFSYIRCIGNVTDPDEQFELMSPKHRMDGAIFIKTVEPAIAGHDLQQVSRREGTKFLMQKWFK